MFLFEVNPFLSDRFGENYWIAEKKLQEKKSNKQRVRQRTKKSNSNNTKTKVNLVKNSNY